MVSLNDSISINYLGGKEIYTHPLYVKWSSKTLNVIAGDVASLKTDTKAVEANLDNLAIISYLATLLRVVTLVG